MTRATNTDIDRAAEALTATMHDAGLLHPNAQLTRTGAYDWTGIRADGTNAAGLPMRYDVIVGTTKGECLQRLWDMARLIEVGRRSLTT